MTLYEVGNLVGRLLASALLVYVAILLLNKFQVKAALLQLKRPFPIAAVIFIFLLGLFGHASAATDSDRAKRPFAVTDFPEAGLTVYIPDRPEWMVHTEKRNTETVIILSTPELYYPPASMEIVLNKQFWVDKKEFHSVALSAITSVRKKAHTSSNVELDQLNETQYGDIQAVEDDFIMNVDKQQFSAKTVVGHMPSGRVVTVFLVTRVGENAKIMHMARKIWNNLKETATQ